jgi:hypothetical protein
MGRRRGVLEALEGAPPNLAGNENLTLEEAALFERLFPGQDMADFGSTAQIRIALLDASTNIVDNARGIQDLSPQQQFAGGVQGQNFGGPTSVNLEQEQVTEYHAQTYIPHAFRMGHHRVGSGLHLAMIGRTIVLKFDQKKSCAGFCRMWNMMMAHVGCAYEFIPADVIQVFADILVGGSGPIGLQNEFSPPFRGRVA